MEKTCTQILEDVLKRKLIGVMFHDDAQQYFDFLNLHGFKRQQEYRGFSEYVEYKGLSRYIINHHNKIPCNCKIEYDYNPAGIRNLQSREAVSHEQKRNIVKMIYDKWLSWERETVEFLQHKAKELLDMGKTNDYECVNRMVKDTSCELKYLERQYIKYSNINWNLEYIYVDQEELHDKYKKKLEDTFKVEYV